MSPKKTSQAHFLCSLFYRLPSQPQSPLKITAKHHDAAAKHHPTAFARTALSRRNLQRLFVHEHEFGVDALMLNGTWMPVLKEMMVHYYCRHLWGLEAFGHCYSHSGIFSISRMASNASAMNGSPPFLWEWRQSAGHYLRQRNNNQIVD